jgi:hypothetical protein
MPLEKKPKKLAPRSRIPPDFRPYKVQDGDGWKKIAKLHGMEVWELIFENFQTRNVEEINWYLHHYVGCKKQTHDGKNWMFSASADPGIIYVPITRIFMPPMYIEGKAPSKLKNVWAGIGKSHSGDLFIIGAHDLTGRIYNVGDELPDVRNAVININGWKFGAGLGASIGAVFIIAHGYEQPRDMIGVSGGWDFDVAIVAKLGDILKGVKGIGKAVDTIQKYKKARYLTENAIKNLGITKPGVYTIPIPFAGAGAHIWGGYKFGDVSVFSSGRGIP